MNAIEKLYYNMDKLSDDWDDVPETAESYKRVVEALGTAHAELEEDILGCVCAYEKQGFIRGFEYAVSLFTNKKEATV